jgi:carbonic anhydrase/acetyltransferase-like protein (isoleucine patch superfamily)
MILTHQGIAPVIGENAFVAPSAIVIGNVVIQDNASIWFNTVVRGDLAPIVIGANSNIQDNCTLHTDLDAPLHIGSYVTVGHNAVVHGCRIDDHVLIGMKAVVLNHAHVCSCSVVAAGALVREGQKVEPFCLVAGMPAQVKKKLGENVRARIIQAAQHYLDLKITYKTT